MKRSKNSSIPALLLVTLLTTCSVFFSGVVAASAAPGGQSPIPGHLIPALQGHTPLGATDGQQRLHLTISLKLAAPAGLQTLIKAQSDRHSSLYHHYLTPRQFIARFAPSQATVNAVVSFLRSQGLVVKSVAANHLSIDAAGTVATVEQAFHVQIANYALDGHTVFAPSNEPSVPASLAGLILNIGGLDNTSTPHRLSVLAPKLHQLPATGPGGGYTPSELRAAYDINPLISAADGTGQTVAIVELDGYLPNDVNTYLSFYNLGSAKYSNVLLDGATGSPTANGGAIEVELDMEVVSAIAPGAAQKIYIAPNGLAGFQGFFDDFNQIVIDDTARVVSNSWGLCESLTGTSSMQAFDNVFAQGAAQGQAFFSASGDSGSADCQGAVSTDTFLSVDYPASDPNVVGVGGTFLNTGSGGSYSSEAVWNNSHGSGGGGLSSYFTQPSYQSGPGVNSLFSNGMREVPDVSADADPNSGYSEYCTDSSGCGGLGWFTIGGTSAASPLWAGVATDINQYLAGQSKPTLGSASAQLYQVFNTPQALTAFHDISSGTNDNNGLNGGRYQATPGYDMASGIGTPDAWNLARDLAGNVPVVTPTVIELATAPNANPAQQTLTIQNNSASSYSWSLGTLPAWLSATPASGTIPAHSSGQFDLSFTVGSTPQPYTTTLFVQDTNHVFNSLPVVVTVVAANVSKTWYFAEGYTGAGFSEFLTLENPNPVQADVLVTYLLGSGAPIAKTYQVAANARATLVVNQEVGPNQNVSMVVTSDQPIVAERPMYFTYTGLPGYSIPGGSDVLGATQLATSFDFGYLDTSAGHATFLTILNQNSSTLTTTIHYFPAVGGAGTTVVHTVPANSRGTVAVNLEGLAPGSYSALVTLDQPGLVERPLYLVDSQTQYTGSADVVGVSAGQTRWDFAEGYTSATFQERYILSNPGGIISAIANLTFYRSDGSTVTQQLGLSPGQQIVVNADAVLGSNNVSNSAEVTSNVPILVERFMSFDYVGPAGPNSGGVSIPGASDVMGANAPGNLFYFAEGYTGATFAEYLTIENPDPTNTATVQVTFLPSNGGAPVVRVYQVGHSSRFTLYTASVMNNQPFSMVVESNVAIVAERPMYFNYLTSGQTGGTDVVGYQP